LKLFLNLFFDFPRGFFFKFSNFLDFPVPWNKNPSADAVEVPPPSAEGVELTVVKAPLPPALSSDSSVLSPGILSSDNNEAAEDSNDFKGSLLVDFLLATRNKTEARQERSASAARLYMMVQVKEPNVQYFVIFCAQVVCGF